MNGKKNCGHADKRKFLRCYGIAAYTILPQKNRTRSFDRALTKALLFFRRGYNLFDGKIKL